jgi:hypothetical protein
MNVIAIRRLLCVSLKNVGEIDPVYYYGAGVITYFCSNVWVSIVKDHLHERGNGVELSKK